MSANIFYKYIVPLGLLFSAAKVAPAERHIFTFF